MAKPLIQFLSETSGFCCQWAFLTQPRFKNLTIPELSKKLGVSQRTISETRAMMRDGGIACMHREGCRKQHSSKDSPK